MTFFNRTLLIASVMAAAATIFATQAHAASNGTVCKPGIYGLGGDWGIGSLRANTPANRAWIRSRYPQKAYRINHNLAPRACTGMDVTVRPGVRPHRIVLFVNGSAFESHRVACSRPTPRILRWTIGATDWAYVRVCDTTHRYDVS